MQLADLPSRRVEAWKWTDLRAALAGDEARLNGPEARPGASPIAALADLMCDAYGPSEIAVEGQGEVYESRQGDGDPGRVGKVIAAPGSSSLFVDRIRVSEGGRQILPTLSEFDVGDGATVMRIVLQETVGEGADAVVLNEAQVKLGAGATFRQFVIADGGRLVRIETQVSVEGEGAVTELNGVYMAAARRHVDLTSQVVHGALRPETRQTVRGVARKGGRGVFQGKFKVGRTAQKTDAGMQHNALLFEDGAEIFAKPELEIYADDVQCAHGNTAGQLDEQAIFYLRSRGIPETEARAMITRAFLVGAVPDWIEDALREEIEAKIDAWLRGGA